MILEAIFNFGIWIFEQLANALPSTAPTLYSLSTGIWDLAQFGVWVIGEDMWLFILGSISAWLTFKVTWGIVLFIYRLIPLT